MTTRLPARRLPLGCAHSRSTASFAAAQSSAHERSAPRPLRGPALCMVVVALTVTAGCAGMRAAAPEGRATPSAEAGEYRIGPADILQISVWKNEALSRTVPVRPDGMISLPLLNEVRAAGRTPMELREVLKNELEDYVTAPEVSVVVEEVHSFTVSVLGEVKASGRYELSSRATVLDLLAEAGGLTEFANGSGIVVLRPDGHGMKRIPFDYSEVISTNGSQENFIVQPGDIIVVP